MREVIAGIGLLVCLFLIPTSAGAMAWPYYGVGGGVGDEGWHGGYHGSWGFTGPYCGYPPEPCVPPRTWETSQSNTNATGNQSQVIPKSIVQDGSSEQHWQVTKFPPTEAS